MLVWHACLINKSCGPQKRYIYISLIYHILKLAVGILTCLKLNQNGIQGICLIVAMLPPHCWLVLTIGQFYQEVPQEGGVHKRTGPVC